jgi:hypothetical protein
MTLSLLMVLTLRPLTEGLSTGENVAAVGTGTGMITGLLDRLKVASYLAVGAVAPVGVVDPLDEGDRAMGIDPRRPLKGRVSETRRPVFWLTKVMVLPKGSWTSRGGSWGGVVDLSPVPAAGVGKVLDARDRGEAVNCTGAGGE